MRYKVQFSTRAFWNDLVMYNHQKRAERLKRELENKQGNRNKYRVVGVIG